MKESSKNSPWNNKKIIVLIVLCSAFFQLTFLVFSKNTTPLTGLTFAEGLLAWNLTAGNGFSINRLGCEEIMRKYPPTPMQNFDFSKCPDPLKKNPDTYTAHNTPGYPMLISATWFIFGENKYIYIQTLQVLLNVLAVFAVYLVANYFFDIKTAILGSAILGLYLPLLLSAYTPVRDIWIYFGIVLLFIIYQRSLTALGFNYKKFTLSAGILLGIMSLIQPIFFYLPAFLGVALGSAFKSWKQGVVIFLGTMMSILIILSPWTIRNYVLFHRFIPTQTRIGAGLWEGMGAFENPIGAILSDNAAFEEAKKENPNVQYGSPEYDEILGRKAIAAIKKYPLWFISAAIRRIPKVLFPLYIPQKISVKKIIQESKAEKKLFFLQPILFTDPALWFNLFDIFLSLFGLIGMWIYHHRWRTLVLFYLIPAYFIAILAPLHVEPRYVLGIRFIFIIFACGSLITLLNFKKNRTQRSIIPPS
ncbi:MAG: hypothetical protein AAB588_04925 [Patescibacteria group bacterium]